MSWAARLRQAFGDQAVAGNNHRADVFTTAPDLTHDQLYIALDSERKQIRLLELQPGESDAPVHGLLRQVSLLNDPKPQYETISYVWGDPTNRGTVYLGERVQVVPGSAEAVLRRVRLPNQSRMVWIDSICIDQTNLIERSQQVAFMNEIYANGIRNLVWLGEDDGFTEAALSDVDKILKNMRAETDDLRDVLKVLYDERNFLRTSATREAFDITDPAPLRALFASPWFFRLWIVQEAALSNDNLCYRGPFEFTLESVLRASIWMVHRRFTHFNLTTIMTLAHFTDRMCGSYCVFPGSAPNISHLLEIMWDFLATDPRDHVYGCLGLILWLSPNVKLTKAFLPDYKASVQEVFSNATKAGIISARRLDVLRHVGRGGEEDDRGWPTWVPEWHKGMSILTHSTVLSPSLFLADNGGLPDLALLEKGDTNVLPVKGFVTGAITEVGPIFALSPDATTSQARLCTDWLKDARVFACRAHRPKEASNMDAEIAATLVASRSDESFARQNEAECRRKHEALQRYLIEIGQPPFMFNPAKSNTELEKMASEYLTSMTIVCRHRRLFLTASGLLGLGPLTVNRGDMVAILYGGRIPFVLRRSQGSAKVTHRLVGHCYVHRIMDGQAVKQHRAEGGEDEIFYLG